ncbi:MAG: metallophosphoesterase family protein, partial [Gemmataceae bacterium]
FLGLVAQTASLYLLNGNHEQASLFNFNQTDERHKVAVGVQTIRNQMFPMPASEGIYTGDNTKLKGIGLLRDYFAWTWGDALFVVLDNYWHSPAQVDSGFHGGSGGGKKSNDRKSRDWWGMTLGNEQYHWFRKTLEGSKAKYKFVFAHHVMGSGRGGIEAADLYEWGGRGRGGSTNSREFKQKRPGWELPVHQLMVKHGVSIFFQGHDHLYARQEKDGVVYQEVPLPANHTYSSFNEDSYRSGKKLPNSGFLRVTVSPEEAKVDYVRCWLPKDETSGQKSGDVAHSYTIKAKA